MPPSDPHDGADDQPKDVDDPKDDAPADPDSGQYRVLSAQQRAHPPPSRHRRPREERTRPSQGQQEQKDCTHHRRHFGRPPAEARSSAQGKLHPRAGHASHRTLIPLFQEKKDDDDKDAEDDGEGDEEPTPKRKRGRPPKPPVPADPHATPKKRGRPPKKPPVDNPAGEEAAA